MGNKIRIGIISLGLIGGSILKSLMKYDYEFICITRNQETINKLKEMNVCASNNIEDLKGCNVVFVCSPMQNTLEILDKLENILLETTIVTDVCSLKEFVCQKQHPYIFIPSHPMAGKETSGFDVSDENLFKGAKWVLTPFEDTQEEHIKFLCEMISKTGAENIIANPKEHDKAVALISHMPLVLSQSLIKAVEENTLAKKLASSGFRDMTRLALSNTVMANDMVTLNNANILNAIELLKHVNVELLNNYTFEEIEQIKQIRNTIYSKDGKNFF